MGCGLEISAPKAPARSEDLLPNGRPLTTEELVKQSFASLKAGTVEIRPGQSKQLALMRRLAPDFINRQLWKACKKFVPVGA